MENTRKDKLNFADQDASSIQNWQVQESQNDGIYDRYIYGSQEMSQANCNSGLQELHVDQSSLQEVQQYDQSQIEQDIDEAHMEQQLKLLNNSKLMITQINKNNLMGSHQIASPVSHRGTGRNQQQYIDDLGRNQNIQQKNSSIKFRPKTSGNEGLNLEQQIHNLPSASQTPIKGQGGQRRKYLHQPPMLTTMGTSNQYQSTQKLNRNLKSKLGNSYVSNMSQHFNGEPTHATQNDHSEFNNSKSIVNTTDYFQHHQKSSESIANNMELRKQRQGTSQSISRQQRQNQLTQNVLPPSINPQKQNNRSTSQGKIIFKPLKQQQMEAKSKGLIFLQKDDRNRMKGRGFMRPDISHIVNPTQDFSKEMQNVSKVINQYSPQSKVREQNQNYQSQVAFMPQQLINNRDPSKTSQNNTATSFKSTSPVGEDRFVQLSQNSIKRADILSYQQLNIQKSNNITPSGLQLQMAAYRQRSRQTGPSDKNLKMQTKTGGLIATDHSTSSLMWRHQNQKINMNASMEMSAFKEFEDATQQVKIEESKNKLKDIMRNKQSKNPETQRYPQHKNKEFQEHIEKAARQESSVDNAPNPSDFARIVQQPILKNRRSDQDQSDLDKMLQKDASTTAVQTRFLIPQKIGENENQRLATSPDQSIPHLQKDSERENKNLYLFGLTQPTLDENNQKMTFRRSKITTKYHTHGQNSPLAKSPVKIIENAENQDQINFEYLQRQIIQESSEKQAYQQSQLPKNLSKKIEKSILVKRSVYRNKPPQSVVSPSNNSNIRFNGIDSQGEIKMFASKTFSNQSGIMFSPRDDSNNTFRKDFDTAQKSLINDKSIQNIDNQTDDKTTHYFNLRLEEDESKTSQQPRSTNLRQEHDYTQLRRKDMVQMLRLANQRIGQLNNKIVELQDIERPVKTSSNKNNDQLVQSLQNALKEKDKQLKLYYDKMNQQKEQHASELKILTNHNKELQRNLIKQVTANKMLSKYTLSISQSYQESMPTQDEAQMNRNDGSQLDVSIPSLKSSHKNSIDRENSGQIKKWSQDQDLQQDQYNLEQSEQINSVNHNQIQEPSQEVEQAILMIEQSQITLCSKQQIESLEPQQPIFQSKDSSNLHQYQSQTTSNIAREYVDNLVPSQTNINTQQSFDENDKGDNSGSQNTMTTSNLAKSYVDQIYQNQ